MSSTQENSVLGVDQGDLVLGIAAGQPPDECPDPDAARRSLEDDRREWEAQRDAIKRQLEARAQELEAEFSELESVQHRLEDDRRTWERQRDELKRQFDCEARDLAARQSELEAAQQKLEEDRRHWESDRQQAAPTASPPASQPNDARTKAESGDARPKVDSAREMIERCRRLLEAEDVAVGGSREASAAALAAPAVQRAPTPPHAERAASNPAEHSEHDHAISQYMANLFERVGGGGSSAPQGGSPSRAAAPRAPDTQAALLRQLGAQGGSSAPPGKAARSLRATAPELAPLPASGPPTPRTAAPERAADFAAMRALANLSAQTAIDKHTNKRQAADLRGRVLATVIGIACGTFLCVTWIRTGCTNNLLLNGASASLIVSLLLLARGSLRSNQDRPYTRNVTPETLAANTKAAS